ncbi:MULTISPECIES: hypothetical protein [unclassified Campylobacter]|nr:MULTISPECIES: hypothetical protein [unclassified Campylobacter]
MKNLSVQEKKDLDSCVFSSLGQVKKLSLTELWLKIKKFFFKKS